MSVYAVNKVCWLTERSADFRERLQKDPEATLSEYKLSPEEASAVKSGDVVYLFRHGVHPFLLQNLARYEIIPGLNRKTYFERLTPLADEL